MALEFAPGKTRIGWIGTGVMGSSMCGHLIAAGYQATVFNRTADKAAATGGEGRQAGRLAAGRCRCVRRRFHDRRLSRRTSARSRWATSGTLAGAKPGPSSST